MRSFKVLGGAMALLISTNASAQLFGPQNLNGPLKSAQQENYPYPGQCYAGATDPGWGIPKCVNGAPGANQIQAKSFLCEDGTATQSPGEATNFTAGPGRTCGVVVPYKMLQAIDPATQPKFQWELLNPPDYTPDVNKFPGAHFYELGLHEAWGFQALANLGLFPNPQLNAVVAPGTCADSASTTLACTLGQALPAGCTSYSAIGTCPIDGVGGTAACTVGGAADPACDAFTPGAVVCTPSNPAATCTSNIAGLANVPNGQQWTGLTCNIAGGCNCAAEAGSYCTSLPGGVVPVGAPLFTPIWGIGQVNNAGGLSGVLSALPATPSANSQNTYVASWPSISIRGTRGTPVVVKWKNEFPNNHTFCPHPEAADWPCAIDRTFMGVKAKWDPATEPAGFAAAGLDMEGVNQFGSAQQPDNSWVTHLHGGEIPPSVDGFAMKWYGNATTGPIYNNSATKTFITPHFDGPHIGPMYRPGGNPSAQAAEAWNYDTYAYPMNQEEALIWFHDHTLGKTHHNVIAGPAGFFPVSEPLKHGAVTNGACVSGGGSIFGGTQPAECAYTWLDPVTKPVAGAGVLSYFPKYDLFFAIQDRSFNEDGSINFSNGLGQPQAAAPLVPNIVPGDNAQVHPVWLPEYFGDHAVINGVLWPKKTVDNGWYRIRFANGSDSRCYTSGLYFTNSRDVNGNIIAPAPGTKVTPNMAFYVIANDQGYLSKPKLIPANGTITHCPGERYELLVNFGGAAQGGALPGTSGSVFMTNQAGAPYPAGPTPFDAGSPDAHLNVLMRFDRSGTAGIGTCSGTAFTSSNASVGTCLPNPATIGANPHFHDLASTVAGQLPLCSSGNGVRGTSCVSAIRHMYLNERVDGLTDAPLGMQINGVPFEYKVTETPMAGDIEIWRIINLTVDAHPMHPHAVKHQIMSRRRLDVGLYKQALCGSTTCQPGTSPGNEMQVVPDVDILHPSGASYYLGAEQFIADGAYNSGNKDASIVLPGYVTNLIAKWDGTWNATVGSKLAPGVPGSAADYATCTGSNATTASTNAACTFLGGNDWKYEPITSGPYVWHCHINSHEDSEMMRTSLVVPFVP